MINACGPSPDGRGRSDRNVEDSLRFLTAAFVLRWKALNAVTGMGWSASAAVGRWTIEILEAEAELTQAAHRVTRALFAVIRLRAQRLEKKHTPAQK